MTTPDFGRSSTPGQTGINVHRDGLVQLVGGMRPPQRSDPEKVYLWPK